jgi:hypothetical protein
MTKDAANLELGQYADFPRKREVFYENDEKWYLIESIGIWNFTGLEEDWFPVFQFLIPGNAHYTNIIASGSTTRISP